MSYIQKNRFWMGKLPFFCPLISYTQYEIRMDEWCIKQHGRVSCSPSALTIFHDMVKSGLTQACLDSPHTLEDVSKAVLQYVKQGIPKQKLGVLAGNSVHCDRLFLMDAMPELLDWLHYRYGFHYPYLIITLS